MTDQETKENSQTNKPEKTKTLAQDIEEGGIQIGLRIGLKLGFKQGLKKGEKKAKQDLVSRMFKEGMDRYTVQRITWLLPEEIEKVIKKRQKSCEQCAKKAAQKNS
jgi:flagellar biosynthesis/type III secretory pathway protein FliH